jgi:hypothetical protein
MTGDELVNVLVPTFLKQAAELLSTVPTRLDQCCQFAENSAAGLRRTDNKNLFGMTKSGGEMENLL